jgi:hypothetical protein
MRFPQAACSSCQKFGDNAAAGKKTALFAPFIYKNQHFTKTGSGRT